MKIGILGTGHVARSLAAAWVAAGHTVRLGSRDAQAKTGLDFSVGGLAEVVGDADVVVNATPGALSVALVTSIGAGAFEGKVLLDVANAATPSFDLMYPTSSLAEELQKALPGAKVVKSLNTFNTSVMTNPSAVPASSAFVSGDDDEAKATVVQLVTDLGWPKESIIDLGGLSSARGPEHYFLLFFALIQALKTPTFNILVVK